MTASKDMRPLTNFGKVFWQNQFRTKIPLPDPTTLPNLQGRTAIITGANTGLGFEAAKQLLQLGLSRLILAVRSIEKGNAAAKELQRYHNRTGGIDVWALDMESYSSIKSFVQKCDKDLNRIDYVILNAGLAPMHFVKTTATGHERTIQVNHLSTALLTILLLPILDAKVTKSTPARLTIVNSLTAHLCYFPNRDQRPLLPSFDDPKLVPFDGQERYGVSKLLNQLFVVHLADLVRRDRIIINMVDPGLTKGTGLAREATGLIRIAAALFNGIAGRTLERGAATYIHALLATDEESHGGFLMSNRISPLAGLFYTDEGKKVSEQIWNETLEELAFANVKSILSKM